MTQSKEGMSLVKIERIFLEYSKLRHFLFGYKIAAASRGIHLKEKKRAYKNKKEQSPQNR